MEFVKRIARHVLREEIALIRWETVEEANDNQALIFDHLARLHRGELTEGLRLFKTRNLAEWEARWRG